MTDAQTLKLLKRFSKLMHSAEACIHSDAHSIGEVMALFDAVQLFHEGRLAGVVPKGTRENLPPLEVFDLKVNSIAIPSAVQHYISELEPHCLGELFYIRIKGNAWREFMELIALRCGVPVDTDPLALGWKPKYWSDNALMAQMNDLILRREPTPPQSRDWFSLDRGHAREYHRLGIHYVGEGLKKLRSRKPDGEWQYCMVHRLGWRKEFFPWPTFLVPPDWSSPDWTKEKLWKTELRAMRREVREDKAKRAAKKRKQMEELRSRRANVKQFLQGEVFDLQLKEIVDDPHGVYRYLGCSTVRQLVFMTEDEVGKKCNVIWIKNILWRVGLRLGMTDKDFPEKPVTAE